MWSAIKNDLFEFVQTVQSDTKITLAKVILDPTYGNIGNINEDDNNENEIKIKELTQSYSTYSEDIENKYLQDFKKFQSNFSLSSCSSDIARILELEDHVSQYYCDLVPTSISAETFWARYYFKLEQLNLKKSGVNINDDDEDEEDLAWDDDTQNVKLESSHPTSDNITSSTSTSSPPIQITNTTPQVPPFEVIESPTSTSKKITPEKKNVETIDNIVESQDSDHKNKKNDDENIRLIEENNLLKNHILELEKEISLLKNELEYYKNNNNNNNNNNTTTSKRKDISEISNINECKIESYVPLNESSGESDGIVVLHNNEISSDSDGVLLQNQSQLQSISSLDEKKSQQQQQQQPSQRNRVSKSNDVIKKTTTKSKEITSPQNNNNNKSPSKQSPIKVDNKNNNNEVEEDDEEEVGWDDSGW